MDNMDLISVSAESDNETASDIPGPGRLLGKLYASVGRQLEHALSALAHSMGRGPVPTAERIRNLLEAEAENSRVSAWSAATPNKKLEKNCKVLVKYTSSRAESTRRQALDEIAKITLFWDRHFHELLGRIGAVQNIRDQELYVWDYCDSDTRLSSRMALSCLVQDDLYALVQQYRLRGPHDASIADHMRRTPEDLFIALRMITHIVKGSAVGPLERLLCEVLDIAESTPEAVEWDEFDKIFSHWFYIASTYNKVKNRRRVGRLLHCIFRCEDKLKTTFRSTCLQKWFMDLENPNDSCFAQLLLLVYAECDEESPLVRAVRTGEEFRSLQYILPFLNQADLTLGRIAWNCTDAVGMYSSWISFLPRSKTYVQRQLLILADYIKSPDRTLKRRAIACIKPLLESNTHLREPMKQALFSATASSLDCYNWLLEETQEACRPVEVPKLSNHVLGCIRRHCDENGQLVHLGRKGCIDSCNTEEWLDIAVGDILYLKVPFGKAFLKADYHPLVAGYTRDGQPKYCAHLYYKASDGYVYDVSQCDVTEGTTPSDLLERYRLENVAMDLWFFVIILRYPPETYPRRCGSDDFMSGEGTGTDATGPYSWRFVGYLEYV